MEIKEISLSGVEMFDVSKYPEEGLYLVNDNDFYIINKKTITAFYLGLKHDWIHLFNEKPKQKEIKEPNGISEDFVLKLIATTLGGEKTKQEVINK